MCPAGPRRRAPGSRRNRPLRRGRRCRPQSYCRRHRAAGRRVRSGLWHRLCRYKLTEDCGCRYVLEGDGLLDEGGHGTVWRFPCICQFFVHAVPAPLNLTWPYEIQLEEHFYYIETPFSFDWFDWHYLSSIGAFVWMGRKVSDVPDHVQGVGYVTRRLRVIYDLSDRLCQVVLCLCARFFLQDMLQASPTECSARLSSTLRKIQEK